MATPTRPSATILAASLLVACSAPAGAAQVSTTAGLLSALSSASPGERILLAPGNYEGVVIRGFKGTATVASANPARPAVLRDLTIDNSSGLVLEDLEMSTVGTPIDAAGFGKMPFRVLHSQNIVLRHLNVHGAPDGALATDISGLLVRWSDHVTVENSEFSHLHNGMQHVDDDHLVIRGNHFHLLWDDGIRGGGSSDVLVENNLCDSNHPDLADTDHPDCIQFWTANTTASVHDIVIRGNVYHRGTGNQVQGIFIRDDKMTYPFLRVVITGNVIEGALWNGISVWGAIDPVIEDNHICGYPGQASWLVVRGTKGAIVRHNRVPLVHYVDATGYKDEKNEITNTCDTHPVPAARR